VCAANRAQVGRLGEMLNLLNVSLVLIALLVIGALAYFALRIWHRNRYGGIEDTGVDFRPTIGFTRLDGWASLALLLENKSDGNVWAEEIEIVLTDLTAKDQTSEASCREIQKIHQAVRPLDMLPISLVGTIYKAAGNPQRRYSCVMSSIVRYSADNESFEVPMPPYRLRMAGLTVIGNRRERWSKSEFKPQDKSRDTQMAATTSK
jgi:hypothetical protein